MPKGTQIFPYFKGSLLVNGVVWVSFRMQSYIVHQFVNYW